MVLGGGPNSFSQEKHQHVHVDWYIVTEKEISNKIKVTPDLRGYPPAKNSYARHFKEKHGKIYIVGKLNKCRF